MRRLALTFALLLLALPVAASVDPDYLCDAAAVAANECPSARQGQAGVLVKIWYSKVGSATGDDLLRSPAAILRDVGCLLGGVDPYEDTDADGLWDQPLVRTAACTWAFAQRQLLNVVKDRHTQEIVNRNELFSAPVVGEDPDGGS